MEDKQFFLSREMAYRLAAIDIGSNSVRLMVAEPLKGGTYRILDEERESTRLGKALQSTGRLDPEAVENTLVALRRFKQIADGFSVTELRTIATCAVREAEDGDAFCRRARDEAGVDVEVVSADQEARFAFYSVERAFDLTGKNVVVADIGGGSTEFILASGNMVEAIYTSPLGAVRLTEIYGAGQGIAAEAFEQLVDGIDHRLKKYTRKPFFAPHLLIGSGGTFTALAEMQMAARGQVGLPVRGYMVTHAEVSHLLDKIVKIPPKSRRNVPGLSPDRADIIVAGLAIIDRVMRRFKVNVLQVHNRGVRDGLILTMIDQSLGAPKESPQDRQAAIERFAATCSGEVEHGRQVARLAGRIHEQLSKAFDLDPEDRPLLEAAARLQDVGYLINYDQHHKHSYHLILNSRIPGFRPRELEIVANIARYHRGAPPKQKHANFRQLSPDDQRKVEQLAAILRLAGGLDRSHSQQVRDLNIQPNGDGLVINVVAPHDPEVDIWGARRRAEMFEKVFGTPLAVEWLNPAEQAEGGQSRAQTA